MPSLCQDVTSAGLLAREEERPGVVRREERPGVMLSSDAISLSGRYFCRAVNETRRKTWSRDTRRKTWSRVMPSLCKDVTSAGLLTRQEERPGVVTRGERRGVMLSSDAISLSGRYFCRAVSKTRRKTWSRETRRKAWSHVVE